ncbi:MAG: cation transporter, partial [Desulfovibrio sp.]|nr:cation transporter [Desulfovibrio sp.]
MMDLCGNDKKRRAALTSFLSAFLLTFLKLIVGLATNSLGLLSEALHSGFDLIAAGLTWIAVVIASHPADEGHPFGHGKAENLSALAQTVFLLATCAWIAYEGLTRLFSGASTYHPSFYCVLIMLISIGVDLNRVRILKRVAREERSQALEADALHFSTDLLSSGVVLLGVFAAWLAEFLKAPKEYTELLAQADTFAALIVAVIILVTSLRMVRSSVNALMDGIPKGLLEKLTKEVEKLPGIKGVPKLRVRESGAQTFVDLTVIVAHSLSLASSHTLAHDAENAIQTLIPKADVTVHTEPEEKKEPDSPFAFVTLCAARHGLHLHHVAIVGEEEPHYLELHVEFP